MSYWSTIARTIVHRRAFVLLAWLAGGALLLPASCHVTESLDVAARVRGSESADVEDAVRTQFTSPLGTWAALVVTGGRSPAEHEGREVLQAILDALTHVPGVTRTLSSMDSGDTLFIGHEDATFLVVGLDPGTGRADDLVRPLRLATHQIEQDLRVRYPDITLRWTGSLMLNHDLRATSVEDVKAAELRALPMTLALLLWAFGAVGAALLSGLAGVLAITMALGVTSVLAPFGHFSILLVNVVTMIGLGLGIDYALLTISRFREARAAGRTATEAAIEAAGHSGHTIALSGLAVAIGFGVLLGVELDELRSVAVGGLIVTLVSVLIATTLLPAILSWIGPVIEIGRVPLRRSTAPHPRWSAWGEYVTRYPWRVLVVAGLPVVVLAAQSLRIRTDVEAGDWLPPEMESTQGLRDLQRMGRSAVIASMPVIVDLPEGIEPLSRDGWNAVRQLGDWIGAHPGVGRVRSLPALTGRGFSRLTTLLIPKKTRRAFISKDERAVMLDVIPSEQADRHDLSDLVRRLRAAEGEALTGLAGTRIRIGGVPAFQVDYGAAVKNRFWLVVSLAITATFLALFVGFRSVLVPLKAVALNLLSVSAALGVVVLVFQDGHGIGWLGIDRPLGGIFSSVPLLVFCTVFGLSMDYEVFLVARVREAWQSGCDERAAIIEGLARTGTVITSAAAIMIAVFAAFMLGHFVVVQMLGLALAVAVALDATVVRLAIGPALLCLAGRWNWWPGVASVQDSPVSVAAEVAR